MEPPISTEPLNESNALDSASVLANESDKSLTGSKIYDGTTTAAFMHMSENEEIDRAIRDYPSLDPETQHEINLKFRKLHNKVKEQGLYDCNYWNYGFDFCRYMLLLGFFCFFFTNEQYLVSACFLGCFWQQIMFVAHDAGHLGITHNRVFDTLLAILIADLCCGLSIGWWKSSHDVHHLVPNHPVGHSVYYNRKLLPKEVPYLRNPSET
jgi:delta8-fatty-acid desaturase